MASRLMSRSLISSARSTFQSGGNSFRAARGRPASSTTRPPPSSNRHPLKNNSTNFRRRCAETMIPLHDAVAGAKLISHLAVNSRSRSALALGLQGFFGTYWSSVTTIIILWIMRML